FPALRAWDVGACPPHGHTHPPNLIPPAPMVPLPAASFILPIPILSCATRTMITGRAAARCGDLGVAVWCGSFFPVPEVFFGSANVYTEMMRQARMGCDIVFHCAPPPLGADPAVGVWAGATFTGALFSVHVGGPPLPSLVNIAFGAAFAGFFKVAGRVLRALSPVLLRIGGALRNGGARLVRVFGDDALARIGRAASARYQAFLARVNRIRAQTIIRRLEDAGTIRIHGDDAARAALREELVDIAATRSGREALGDVVADGGVDIAGASRRMAELEQGGELARNAYHGTSSAMLDGLDTSGGRIMSEADMVEAGIRRVTGEGDGFSGAAGAKTEVYIGLGDEGFGTAAAYARANHSSPHYNPRRYTYDELVAEVDRLQAASDGLAARGQERAMIMGPDRTQIDNRLGQLSDELDARNALPPEHPRRVGGPDNLEDYPVVFEFRQDNLNIESIPGRTGEAGVPLGGEAMHHGSIDLGDDLVRAYAPAAHVDDLRQRLSQTLGHDNFEVLPLESTSGLNPQGRAATTEAATAKNSEDLEQMFSMVVDLAGN
ncbi:MAG: PAAR domain-containing protein, partial [Myxococcota bacterium]